MPITIILTCAASQVAPVISRSIKSYPGQPVRLIGVDIKPKEISVGASFCDDFYQVPFGADSGYADAITNIVAKENVKIIFPGSDDEVLALARIKDQLLTKYGCRVVCSEYETTKLASDKLSMLMHLKKSGVHTGQFSEVSSIKSILNFADLVGYPQLPFIIKPKNGQGSKGFKLIKADINEKASFFNSSNFEVSLSSIVSYFEKFPEEMAGFLMMEYLPGDKYSADILLREGEVAHCIFRNSGIAPKTNPPTQMADIVFGSDLTEYAKQVTETSKFDYFLQLELGRDKEGKLAYIETNLRLDATLPITEGAGINFFHEMISYSLTGQYLTTSSNQLSDNKVRFFRYWEHTFINV